VQSKIFLRISPEDKTSYEDNEVNKYCLILILKVPSDIGLCNAAGRLFHNIPPLNWTARRPYDENKKINVTFF